MNSKQMTAYFEPALSDLAEMVEKAGYTVSQNVWEDESMRYACSFESTAGTMGHPAFEAQFNRETAWLTVTGRAPVNIAA